MIFLGGDFSTLELGKYGCLLELKDDIWQDI
jgi:hypothetical protein